MLMTHAPLLTILFAGTFSGMLWIWLGMSAVQNCWLMFMLDGIWLNWATAWSVILGTVMLGTENIASPRFIYSPTEFLFQSIMIWMFFGSTLLIIVGSCAYLLWKVPKLMRQLFPPSLFAGLLVFMPLLPDQDAFLLSGMIAIFIIFAAHQLLRQYQSRLSSNPLTQLENHQ